MENSKIDKAVFYRLGETQTYACVLYKNDSPVGNFLDLQGLFVPDIKEWLKTKYPGLTVI